MSDLNDVNNVLSVALYKKLQKQLEPIVEKLDALEHATQVIESTPGPQGNRGETGLSGKVGPTGPQGKQGIAGPQGIQGETGTQGIAGPQGKQGITGEQGIAGPRGLTGERGERGLIGPQGEQGIEGIEGIAGPQGKIGPQGLTGEQGIAGQTGPQGIQGEQGKIGPQGIAGQTGPQGIQGETGERGIQGEQGERGIQGETGERGAQGIEGKRGERGIQGEQGPQGKQGIQGETGPEGPSGKDAVIPDINDIIDPFIVETKTNIDTYIDRSEKTFKSWQSIVNNQLSSIGGGGEVWLGRLNDVDRVSTKVDGAYLKYNAATKKWVGDVNGGNGGDGGDGGDLLNHIADETKHLTVEQNTLLDAITVTSIEINHLANVTSTIQGQLDGKSATSHGHSTATTSTAGFLSTSDKTKLDAIVGNNTGDQTITLGGDASGSGSALLTVTLGNTGVVAGEYNSNNTSITPFTVDSKGRITATDTDIVITPDWTSVANTPSTLSGYGITDAVSIGDTQTISGAKEFTTSPVVPRPTESGHAATKAYVDDVSAGLHVHQQVHVILTVALATATGGTVAYTNGTDGVGAKLTVIGGSTIIDALNAECGADDDLVAGADGSRIIINGEVDNKNWNGIYIISNVRELTRSSDFDSSIEMAGGDFVFVTHGITHADTGWVLSEPVTTVGSSNVEFVQFSGSGSYDAGDGLHRDGTIFSVVGTTGRIIVGPSVDLATHGVAGTYQSVTTDAYGRVTSGTNPTTLSGYGITDAATSTSLSNHISDNTRHLTEPQNILIDGIAVTSAEINHLTGVTSNVQSQLNGKSSTSHIHDNATTGIAGFMSAENKAKLDTIQSGAEVNVNADWNSVSGDSQILNKPTTLSGYGITDAANDSNIIIGLSLFL